MADDADRAKALQDESDAAALCNHLRASQPGPGREDCEECGDDIPAERRIALPSCTRCIDCQTTFEMNARRHM